MQRAVAFWSKFVGSEGFATLFDAVAEAYFDQVEAGPGGEEITALSVPTAMSMGRSAAIEPTSAGQGDPIRRRVPGAHRGVSESAQFGCEVGTRRPGRGADQAHGETRGLCHRAPTPISTPLPLRTDRLSAETSKVRQGGSAPISVAPRNTSTGPARSSS